MADIDEAVELARRCLDVGGADYNECDLNTLARAVLAMAARLDALAPVMGKPIASRITNSAPIERELVMDADEEHRPVHVDAGPSRPARSSPTSIARPMWLPMRASLRSARFSGASSR